MHSYGLHRYGYIVMAYIVMAYILVVLAYIGKAYVVMARAVIELERLWPRLVIAHPTAAAARPAARSCQQGPR